VTIGRTLNQQIRKWGSGKKRLAESSRRRGKWEEDGKELYLEEHLADHSSDRLVVDSHQIF
jgi:hypothetical protein